MRVPSIPAFVLGVFVASTFADVSLGSRLVNAYIINRFVANYVPEILWMSKYERQSMHETLLQLSPESIQARLKDEN